MENYFLGYIDPGTGSMLFSIIIGIATTAFFLLRGLFIKMKYRISGEKVEANKDKLQLVIFSDSKRYWNVFKGICDELEKKGFDAEYWTMSEDDPALGEKYEHIACKFIGGGNGAFAKLNTMKASVCLSTTPGLNVLQWKRSKNVDKYIHIFHSVSYGCGYRMFGLDHYDTILLPGENATETIRKIENLRGKKNKELPICGLTYLDAQYQKYLEKTNRDKKETEIKTILCAPTWGKSGLLSRFGEKLIDALIATGYDVIIRPHPQSKTAEKDLLDTLQAKYPNGEHFSWNYDNDNFSVLDSSDILISDFSGVIFDYAFIFNKPVICADTTYDSAPYDSAWLEEGNPIIQLALSFSRELDEKDFANMKQIIDETISSDTYTKAREDAKKIAWANIGKASSVAAEIVMDAYNSLNTDKKESV